MRHIFGLRNDGKAGLLIRGNGRCIMQHIRHSISGGSLVRKPIAPIADVVDKIKQVSFSQGGRVGTRTYTPLRFK